MKNHESGFIAVISIVIIAALLMAVSFSLSTSGFFARTNITDTESKEHSMALAQACAEDARLRLTADATYQGHETLVIDAHTCTIQAITLSGSTIIIPTTATFQSAVTHLQTTVDSATLTIISWQEQP